MTGSTHDDRSSPVLDYVGVGFGPSNLAFAVAVREHAPQLRGLFFERARRIEWHPGMLLPGSRMQISFLKDLATLRNPTSAFTFLQYLKAKNRLERFANLREFHPTRAEYQDYLRWAAQAFDDQLRYRTEVTRIYPQPSTPDGGRELFTVETRDLATGTTLHYRAHNVVYAAGGVPRIPRGVTPGARIIHSGSFLHRFPEVLAERSTRYRFAVVGDGQSAGEIALELMRRYPEAQVDLFVRGHTFRPADSSSFVNEVFFSEAIDTFFAASNEARAVMRDELRSTNFGVVDARVLRDLYELAYSSHVAGESRLVIHPYSHLESAHSEGDGVVLTVRSRFDPQPRTHDHDGLVLATGYDRRLDAGIFAEVLARAKTDVAGNLEVTRAYRVQMDPPMSCGLFVQGFAGHSHGISDSLLSTLCFRAKRIVDDMVATRQRITPSDGAEYPPRRHVEDERDKLYAVMERFRFATVICTDKSGTPMATQVPLTLDRSRGRSGVLFGHMDKANPQAACLEGQSLLLIFNGPNAYISPHIYETDQLPTWNSIAVHVRGRARLIHDRETLVNGLAGICEHEDREAGAYRLALDDPRIGVLIDFIVGFEVTIEDMIGRFKLSQDRNEADRRRAAGALLRRTRAGERGTIEALLDYPKGSLEDS